MSPQQAERFRLSKRYQHCEMRLIKEQDGSALKIESLQLIFSKPPRATQFQNITVRILILNNQVIYFYP